MNNKVILIGESHYHGLNLLRCFGKQGIRPVGIIVGNHTNRFLESSKYWGDLYFVDDNDSAITILDKFFKGENDKAVVIPWSDGALAAIDKNLYQLSEHFIISSIKGIPGEISKYMNKKMQTDLALELGLNICPSEIVTIPLTKADINKVEAVFSFPIFLKPVDSTEGSKKDMRKINSIKELIDYCKELNEKGFGRILVQQYLDITVELDFMGYCNEKGYSYSIAEKKRIWPIDGGAACFGEMISSNVNFGYFEDIIQKIQSLGYSGPFDIDIFQVGDELFFNEINWRSSANVYGACLCGNNYPYLWYCSESGEVIRPFERYSGDNRFFMNEFWDFQYVIRKKISLKKWLEDRKKTDSFAFWDKDDPKPFWVRLFGSLGNKFYKRK